MATAVLKTEVHTAITSPETLPIRINPRAYRATLLDWLMVGFLTTA